MSGFNPVVCGGTTYYEITCCAGNTILTGNISGSAPLGTGPIVQNSAFNSDYSINVAGVNIPIFKTTRTWASIVESSLGQPTGPLRGIYASGAVYATFCAPFDPDAYTISVSENCVIEASTLHYLDLRYGVCLYKYVKESLVFSKTASDAKSTTAKLSSSAATFQGPYGEEIYWKMKIKNTESVIQGLEEWILITNGVQQVISSTTYTRMSMADRIISSISCGNEDAIGEILLFPAPGTYSNPVDCDVLSWAWYKAGVSPAGVNYFYPDWCKQMQADPFWAAAETARQGVVVDHNSLTSTTTYVPPPITVDPIPIGSYAKHPVVGEVYQWLTTTMNGVSTITTSPALTTIIDTALAAGQKTHDKTLVYPISLV
jgi:hypothetical protein